MCTLGSLHLHQGGGIEEFVPFSFSLEMAKRVDLKSFVDDAEFDPKGRRLLNQMPA